MVFKILKICEIYYMVMVSKFKFQSLQLQFWKLKSLYLQVEGLYNFKSLQMWKFMFTSKLQVYKFQSLLMKF